MSFKKYKTFWIILGIIVLILVALLAYGLSMRQQESQEAVNVPQTKTQIGLGELGAECGGELRLPCKPGLKCSKAGDDSKGVCVKDIQIDPGKTEPL